MDRNVSGTGKANSYDLFINTETLDLSVMYTFGSFDS